MTPEEQKAWAQVVEFQTVDNGYWREQATRPQTLGYALGDSPVGLAAWIFEKFQAWTDNEGRPQDALSNDRMLDNISIYWFTGTIASSMRLYLECAPAWPGSVQRREDRLSDRGQRLPQRDLQGSEVLGATAVV
jgi:hypothetical protein